MYFDLSENITCVIRWFWFSDVIPVLKFELKHNFYIYFYKKKITFDVGVMWAYFFFRQITFQLILTTIFQLFAWCKVGPIIVLNVAVLVVKSILFSSLVKQIYV